MVAEAGPAWHLSARRLSHPLREPRSCAGAGQPNDDLDVNFPYRTACSFSAKHGVCFDPARLRGEGTETRRALCQGLGQNFQILCQ